MGFEGFKSLLDVITDRADEHIKYDRGLGPIEVGKIDGEGKLTSDSIAQPIEKDQYLVCESLLEHEVEKSCEGEGNCKAPCLIEPCNVKRRLEPGDGYLIVFQGKLPIVVDRLIPGSET